MKATINTNQITRAALIAAAYASAVLAFAPISYGIFQLRAATLIKSLAVLRPEFAVGFAIGNLIANQVSPFGIYDWGIMPLFDLAGAYTAYRLRSRPWLAVLAQSLVIAVGVATFPLGLGAHLPWLLSFTSVFLSTLALITAGTIALVPAVKAVLK